MPETNDSTPHVNDVSEARAKFEQARLTRRSALRKLGMTSGMALFSLFAVDDLARIAVKKLAQHQETKAIADSIAHDFKDMGVAFAADTPSSVTPEAPPDPKAIGLVCKGKADAYGPATNPSDCISQGCNKYYHGGQQQEDCKTQAEKYV